MGAVEEIAQATALSRGGILRGVSLEIRQTCADKICGGPTVLVTFAATLVLGYENP
jgi:hypothetical protein